MGTDEDTLRLWESLLGAPAVSRPAVLMVHRTDAADLEAALDLPLARAGALALHELRDRTDGRVPAIVSCGDCGAVLDVQLDVDALAAAFDTSPAPVEDVRVAGLVLRSPTTRDLLVALAGDDPPRLLRERCMSPVSPGHLGQEEGDAATSAEVDAAFEELTGAAGLSVRAECPDCGTTTIADVDLTGLLVDLVDDQARRLLLEVAELASAYGWSEPQVLALSQPRRRAYLELARR